MKKLLLLTAFVFIFGLGISSSVHAQEMSVTMKAEVLEVTGSEDRVVTGVEGTKKYQTLKVKILSGPETGATITANNDYLLLKKGDVFYVTHTVDNLDAIDAYNVAEPYRMTTLYIVASMFILCVIVFGGWQGIRGLASLIASVLVIFYLFLPGILHGFSPVLLSLGICSLIIIIGSYITHGFNRTTTSAVVGMLATILVTGLLAYWSVLHGRLTGFDSEESTALAYAVNGHVDFVGLLLGGMLIGLLGVLYDAAIGQAVAVEELHRVGPHIDTWTIYKRAIRMGKEHIGALVNTLAIAYVGASLPLLLVYSNYISAGDITLTINREVFASELLRIMIGSIGLMMAVPITTLVAMWIIVGKKKVTHDHVVLKHEHEALEQVEHHH